LGAEGAAVQAVELAKRYGGVRALDGASLAVQRGEVRGLVGANGAGKSTLVKCLTGIVRPEGGQVLVDGAALSLGRPNESLRCGIVSVPQELTVAPTMTVAENVMLGHEPRRLGGVRGRVLERAARQALDSLGADVDPRARVGQLPLIEQRIVMIARALSYAPRLAIFDEATATLSPVEARRLLETIGVLRRRGVSILYVSHQLAEVEEICDTVTVLRDGAVLADLGPGEATHGRLVGLLASDEQSRRPAGPAPPRRDDAPVVLDAEQVAGERLRSVTLRVRAGEIVGLAGLAGSGARELLLTICGAVPFAGGRIEVGGRALRAGNAPRAVSAGVGFLPGDRSLGTFPSHSVRHNVSLAALRRHARGPFVDVRSERRDVAGLLARVGLRADPEQPVASLSGGNQQKALMARWIASGARLLLLDDPTAGVDVATRPEIHTQIESLAAAGAGVLLVSTDVDELAALSHRVLIFAHGAVAGELAAADLTPARVLAAMSGRQPEEGGTT
jgi:ribose transport system ATP-binding protein